MYSYVLLGRVDYESTWVLGVFGDADNANDYLKSIKKKQLKDVKMSDAELIQRALHDEWDDYMKYYVEVWDGTQRIRTFKYNSKTGLLDKEPKRLGDLD